MHSPWMSGTEGSISPFMEDEYLENYTPDMENDMTTSMDLSWLTTAPSYTSTTTGLGISSMTSDTNNVNNAMVNQPIHIADKNSISQLLTSQIASNCQQLLEDPIRRKPGRKPKGTLPSPQSSNYLQQLAMQNSGQSTEFMGVGDKKEERKYKNREAADQSRKRLKDRTRALEEYTGALTEENEALRKHLRQLENK